MMLKNNDENLNTLRVSTNEWPGLVYYQGLTTRTTLSTSEKATQTTVNFKKPCRKDFPSNSTLTRDKLDGRCKNDKSCGREHDIHDSSNVKGVSETAKTKRVYKISNVNTSSKIQKHNCESKTSKLNGASKITTAGDESKTHKSNHTCYLCKENEVSKTNDESDREAKSGDDLFDDKTSSSSTSQHSLPTDSESSSSDGSIKQRKPSHPDKTLLPLPNVSWNEMARVDDVTESPSLVRINSPWLFNPRTPRPHTAGPRFIVPLKHTSPVGLNEKDIIRGTRLCNKTSSEDELQSDNETKKNGIGDNISKPALKQCFEKRSQGKDENSNRISFKHLSKNNKDKETDSKIEALELTITSIHLEPSAPDSTTSAENTADDLDTSRNNDENVTVTNGNNNNNNSISAFNGYNFNTMEGIRRSYRRAQSAPPTHQRSDRISGGNTATTVETSGHQQKPFSNLYWRAKSAYHKRIEESSEEDQQDANFREDRSQCYTGSSKRTLLRPLLPVNSEIKHSAGCPYKCKGCFKACLVSDDYVQKAIAKAVQESKSPVEPRRERLKSSRVLLPVKSDIVKEALGRSQPLFHQVYGVNKVRGRIKIRPWPNYDWMDLRMKRDESGKGADKDQENKTIDEDSRTTGVIEDK